MSAFTVREATEVFYSYGPKWDKELVQKWMNDPNTMITSNQVCEDDLRRFNDWYRRKDTAYETGIDDKTNNARLLEEITKLKKEIDVLEEEKRELEWHIEDFF